MKVIIAGTRTLTDPTIVHEALEAFVTSHGRPTEIVYGGATGADELGKEWAIARGITVKTFYAQWSTFGKSAGPKRNAQMVDYANALVAIWDGVSRGTADVIAKMRNAKKLIMVWRY